MGETGIVGEIFGADEGTGEFEGDGRGLAGEAAGTAVFAGAGDTWLVWGAGAGALKLCASLEYERHKNSTNKANKFRLNIFFSVENSCGGREMKESNAIRQNRMI